MHILHVTPCLAPAWAYGRVASDVHALATAQATAGHTVVVLTTDALAPHERLPAGDRMEDGLRVVRVRNVTGVVRTWLDLSSPRGMRSQVRTLLGGAAISLVHLHQLRSAENLAVLRHLPGAMPMVVSPHGTARPGQHRSAPARLWDRLVLDRVLARADAVVATKEDEAEAVSRLASERGIPLRPGALWTVPSGVDLTPVTALPSREEGLARFGLRDAPVVLWIGRINDTAGLDTVVAAHAETVRRVPGGQLLLVGGDHGALAATRAMVAARALDGHVQFAGYLGDADRRLAYAAADLFVGGRGTAGWLPESAVYALAAGLPLVGASTDPGETAGVIVELLTDTERMAQARTAAREAASRRTWPAVASAMDAVYDAARAAG